MTRWSNDYISNSDQSDNLCSPPFPLQCPCGPTRTMAYVLDSAATGTGKIYMYEYRPYYSRLIAVIGSRLADWCRINTAQLQNIRFQSSSIFSMRLWNWPTQSCSDIIEVFIPCEISLRCQFIRPQSKMTQWPSYNVFFLLNGQKTCFRLSQDFQPIISKTGQSHVGCGPHELGVCYLGICPVGEKHSWTRE